MFSIGDTINYGFYTSLKIVEIEELSYVLKDKAGNRKRVYKDLVNKYGKLADDYSVLSNSAMKTVISLKIKLDNLERKEIIKIISDTDIKRNGLTIVVKTLGTNKRLVHVSYYDKIFTIKDGNIKLFRTTRQYDLIAKLKQMNKEE